MPVGNWAADVALQHEKVRPDLELMYQQDWTLWGKIKARGDVDLIDCSSGGNDPRQSIAIHPGYQVPYAEAVRRETGLPTAAVGLIHSADMAEQILANGQADLVVLGRTLMSEPYWPLKAARALRADARWPIQYERSNIF